MASDRTSFIMDMLDSGDGYSTCIARYFASGAVVHMQEFLSAECERGTKPADLVLAMAMVQSATMAELLKLTMKPGAYMAAVDDYISAFGAQLREHAAAVEARDVHADPLH